MRIVLDVFSRALWVATGTGAVFGVVEYTVAHLTVATVITFQQEMALSTGCILWAVIPFVAARAFDEITRPAPGQTEPHEAKS